MDERIMNDMPKVIIKELAMQYGPVNQHDGHGKSREKPKKEIGSFRPSHKSIRLKNRGSIYASNKAHYRESTCWLPEKLRYCPGGWCRRAVVERRSGVFPGFL